MKEVGRTHPYYGPWQRAQEKYIEELLRRRAPLQATEIIRGLQAWARVQVRVRGRERKVSKRTGHNRLRHLKAAGRIRQTRLRGPYVLVAPGEARVTFHQLANVVLPSAELSFHGELAMKVMRADGRIEYYGPEG